MEGAIFAAEVANADNNNLPIPPTISKLDFSSVGPPLPLDSLFKRTKSSIKQNVSTITRAVCSSGFISAVKAEITNNNDEESNADDNDESNIENDIGWYRRDPPPAPSKQRNRKRVFIELGDDNNEQQEEGVVSRLSNALSQSMWNVKNGSGFRDRPLNPKLVKRLRKTNTSPSNSTSNTPTNNATDTTTAVEEEELEFFTENGGFNNEEGEDGTSGGELNDEEDSIKDPMDISADEESSPSTITSAVSNTGGTKSVANDLILEGELQLSHFNNDTALGERGSNAGEGTLTAAAVDNNVLPAAERGNQPGTEGGEEDIRRPEVGDVMSLTYKDTGDAVGVVCELTQDKLSLAFVNSEGDVNHVERGVPFTDKDLKYVTDEHGNTKRTVPEGWEEWKPPEDDTDTEEEPNYVESGASAFTCPHCTRGFSSKQRLDYHIGNQVCTNKQVSSGKEKKKKGGGRHIKKAGGTATPQEDDIIVGDGLGYPKAISKSLSNAIASRVEAYSTAEGDAAKEAVVTVRILQSANIVPLPISTPPLLLLVDSLDVVRCRRPLTIV